MKLKLLLSIATLALIACNNTEQGTKVATTPKVSSSAKVEALMADMTLDEKLAQISCVWFGKSDIYDSDGSFNPEKMKEKFPHGIGCFARPQDTIGMEDTSERKDVNDATVVRRMSARTPSETVDLVNTGSY